MYIYICIHICISIYPYVYIYIYYIYTYTPKGSMSKLCLDASSCLNFVLTGDGSHVYTFAYPPLPTAVLASSAQESGQQGMMSARFKR